MFGGSAAVIESFSLEGENLGPKWTLWVERLNQLFDVNEIAEEKDRQRVSSLFLFGGSKLHELHKTLPEAIPNTVTGVDTEYKKAIYRLTKYFNPSRNVVVEQFAFSQAKQAKNETIAQYVTRLRILATYCEFASTDKEIVRQVIQGCESSKLRRSYLKEPGLVISRLLEIGRIHDTIEMQLDIVEGREGETSDTVAAIMKHSVRRGRDKRRPRRDNSRPGETKRTCFKCGGKYPHVDRQCPALGKKCNACGELNHFAAVCKGNKSSATIKNQVDAVSWAPPVDENNYVFSVGRGLAAPEANVTLLGAWLRFKIDTGAQVNIIDEVGFKALNPKPKLLQEEKPTFAYGVNTPLQVHGTFEAKVSCKGRSANAEFFVVKGHFRCLLSFTTCSELKLVQILNQVSNRTVEPQLKFWSKKFPSVFTEKLGCLKNFKLKLHIDKSVKPIQANPRNKPFHLLKIAEEQINKKLQMGVIEEVKGQPTEWLSETVQIGRAHV